MSGSPHASVGGACLRVVVARTAADAQRLVARSWTPVEAAYGRQSVIDDLRLDHHGDLWELGPVALRAATEAHGARRDRPWFVTAAADADATLAMAALAGTVTPGQWLVEVATIVAAMDVHPHDVDLLTSDAGRTVLAWRRASRGVPATHAVETWRHLQRLGSASRVLELDAAAADERRRRTLAAASLRRAVVVEGILTCEDPEAVHWSTLYGRRPSLPRDELTGWRHPLAVIGDSRAGRVTVACADSGLAHSLFGATGLMAVAEAAGDGWGGRDTIVGSPRDRRVPTDGAALRRVALLLRHRMNAAPTEVPSVSGDRRTMSGGRGRGQSGRSVTALVASVGERTCHDAPAYEPRPAASSPVVLTAGQREVLSRFQAFLASDRRVAVLAGRAGTGKTTLVRQLVEACLATGRAPCLMAPTGQTVHRLVRQTGFEASTIHSTLYAHERTTLDEGDGTMEVVFGRGVTTNDRDVWIVDEASLIGNRPDCEKAVRRAGIQLQFGTGEVLADLANAACRREGRQIVLIGDPDQLPPVMEDESPAFDPAVLGGLFGEQPARWRLGEVTRQAATSAIVAYAHRWLDGGMPPIPGGQGEVAYLGTLDADLIRAFDAGHAVVVTPTNDGTARWNQRVRDALGRPNARPGEGDRLVLVRSSRRHGLLNGDEATVTRVVGEPMVVRRRLGRRGPEASVTLQRLVLSFHGQREEPVEIEMPVVLDGIAGARDADLAHVDQVLTIDAMARFRRSNLPPTQRDAFLAADDVFGAARARFGYARTGHRAQGGEWERVVVDFDHSRFVDSRWAYTALTRARSQLLLANLPRVAHGRASRRVAPFRG